MKHTASNNWGNTRKNPMQGIRVGDPAANRMAVKVLMSGTESETLACVKRHRENVAWLKLADELEFSSKKPRTAVLTLVRAYLAGKEVEA